MILLLRRDRKFRQTIEYINCKNTIWHLHFLQTEKPLIESLFHHAKTATLNLILAKVRYLHNYIQKQIFGTLNRTRILLLLAAVKLTLTWDKPIKERQFQPGPSSKGPQHSLLPMSLTLVQTSYGYMSVRFNSENVFFTWSFHPIGMFIRLHFGAMINLVYFFNFSPVFEMRSSWSMPQATPGLIWQRMQRLHLLLPIMQPISFLPLPSCDINIYSLLFDAEILYCRSTCLFFLLE